MNVDIQNFVLRRNSPSHERVLTPYVRYYIPKR